MSSLQKTLGLAFLSVCLSCELHARAATAGHDLQSVIRFQLCSRNVKSLGLYKQSGTGKLWHFVVILNDMGTMQFRELENKHLDEPVEIVWAGVKFGSGQLNIVNLSTVRNLILVSKWEPYGKARAKMTLLHDRLLRKSDLAAPCGAQVARDSKRVDLI